MGMLRILLVCGLAMIAATTPAMADPESDDDDKLRLNDVFRKLLDEMKPQLEELIEEAQPHLDSMMQMMDKLRAMDDPRHYQLPEVLPNGDIIIRRRPDAPPYTPKDPEQDEAERGVKT